MASGRLIASTGIALTLLGLGPVSARGALPDADCSGVSSGGSSGGTGMAQTFTAVHTGTIVRARMWVAKEAGGDFQMQIFNADGSGPIGGPIGSAAIPDSSIPSTPSPNPMSPPTPVDGNFSPPAGVVAGHSYAIVLTRPASFGWLAQLLSDDPCPGRRFTRSNETAPWEPIDLDLPFQTFVNPTNDFTVGKLKGRRLSLTLPGPGAVDISSGLAGGPRIKHFLRSTHTDIPSAGTVRVPIRLLRRGKTILRNRGKLKARTAITYTPTGGEPNSQAAKLKLKRR